MKKLLATVFLFMLTFRIATPAIARTILFESGTLGATGVPFSEIETEAVRATNVNAAVFVGTRFFLDEPAITTQVGGHFIKNPNADESFFGAIIKLKDENDFPDSGDLSTSDVLGTALLAFPGASDEIVGDLKISLEPGWYSLVFGSGLFGATGSGGALRNNPDIEDPVYLAYQPGFGWSNFINPIFSDHRFVLRGNKIPEPSALIIVFSALTLAFINERQLLKFK